MYDYDIAVIGAGSAGLVASKLAAGLGKKTALVERNKIGGDCTWYGCIPSKALIKSAEVVHQARRLEQFGIKLNSPLSLNPKDVMTHVRAVRQADYEAHPPDRFKKDGIDLIFGPAKFLDRHRIILGERVLSSDKFIICAGSRAATPRIAGLAQIPYLTNESIFELESLPGSMLILGGGPIGSEMASALNRLGVRITVIQRAATLLPNDDSELTTSLMNYLRDEGINILTESTSQRFYKQNGRIWADIIDNKNQITKISGDSLLVAVGRIPNIDNLDLNNAGVEFDKGGLKVDKHLRTTAPNIYGAGDVVPPYLFTHVAEHEAVIATRNACLPIKSTPDYDNILWCTFTDPALAHAGLTESEARERFGGDIRIYKWQYSHVDRANTDLAAEGFAKIICNKKGRILGIHILGTHAAELMHEVQLAKSFGKPLSKIAPIIHAYPSYSDAIRQPAKRCYIDMIQNNFFIKLMRKIKPAKNR
jgi:pyruvate/2-oxoglutarate dehydrogenase complex dihydrolipoamide dehydrogenase (E3) component